MPSYTGYFLLYSFRIAAKGLSLIALRDGIKPATIPINIANATASGGRYAGMRQMLPDIPMDAPISLDTTK